MAAEVRSYKLPIPGPAILSIAGRMHTCIAPTSTNIALKGRFLIVVEDVARGKQKYNGLVLCQIRIGKKCCVFRKIDRYMMLRSKHADRRNTILDRGMAEAACFRENKHLRRPHRSYRSDATNGSGLR